MPTPAELRAEILSGPLAAELATPWNIGSDTGVAAILNRADQAGYIPAVPLAKYLSDQGLIAHFDLIRDHLKMPCADDLAPSVAAPYGLYKLSSRLLNAIKGGFRASVAEIAAGCDVLITAGLLTTQQKTAVLSLETKISRAQVVWGLDTTVSYFDVSQARKAG